MTRFAIVGAGIAGVSLAHRLVQSNHDCTVFEKSQEVGGRLATEQFEDWQVDYGTQYFTVRTSKFMQEVEVWHSNGWIKHWSVTPWVLERETFSPSPDDHVRYVGTRSMNCMVQEMSRGLNVYLNTRIDRLERQNDQWRLWDEHGEHYGMFDIVLLTAPLAQSLALLPSGTIAETSLRTSAMSPIWVYALSLKQASGIEADALFSNDGLVTWAAKNSSKPNRDATYETWVMHFAPQWTANHLDASEELLRHQAIHLLDVLAGHDIGPIHGSFRYRWLYARASSKEITIPQWDANMKIGLAGDWTLGNCLEDAWLSAQSLADQLLDFYL
jgi:renalase